MKKSTSVSGLIALLSSSFFVALIVVLFLVFTYVTPGTYRLEQLLISPQAIEKGHFTRVDPLSGRHLSYTFDQMEFVFSNRSEGGRGRSLSLPTYRRFYERVKRLRSVAKVDEAVRLDFMTAPSATLTLFAEPKEGQEAFIQQIEFLDERGFFRFLLHEQSDEGVTTERWIYFRAHKEKWAVFYS